MSGLLCEDLTLRYGKGAPVVRALSIVFESGVWAVVGPNGAGKSTLLRALAGLHRPDEGRVTLGDHDAWSMAPRLRARRVAYIAQRADVWGGYTVRDIVTLGRHALARDDGAIERALRAVGLWGRADEAYRALSVGQQQRVMIARALAQIDGVSEPVLIADEPLSSQDPAHAVAIVERLRATSGTVVAAIHDLTTALRCADHALLLNDAGHAVAAGGVHDVLTPGRLEHVFGVGFDLVRTPGGPALVARSGTGSPARA